MTSADAHEALIEEILDSKVLGADGSALGEVTQVFLDDLSGRPTWVRVATGTLLTKQVLAPLHGATLAEGRLQLPWTRAEVGRAPGLKVEDRLAPEQERSLMEHYGLAPAADVQG